jgi:two-component system, NtrC family, sensor histidine kinase KinB
VSANHSGAAMTLRQRLLLTLLPTLLLLAVLGAAGVAVLQRVGGRINLILRENYDSVVAMVGLNEALERIDSSFNFAMLRQEKKAYDQYRANWPAYEENLRKEQNNITLPGEQELVDELVKLTREYRKMGDSFFRPGRTTAQREADYLGSRGKKGLAQQFADIKRVSEAIREMNQRNMEDASRDAQQTATASLYGFGAGLAATALLAGLLAWSTVRATLRPIQEMTRSALAIGAGNLDQVVPVRTRDELGALAGAFNGMARQLRAYRQTHLARLLRAQRTAQATIDSFPDPILVVDPEGRVEMANPAARRVLGVTPAPAESAAPSPPPAPWQPPEPLPGPLRDALQQQRPFLTQAFDQTVAFRLDGEERTFLPQVLPIQDPYGYTLGAAVVFNDVTRFRLLDQFKSDLVATVSHELKTPLTSVRLVLHLLLEETVGPLTPKQTELLIDARDNAERLLHIIEHLLALARLQQGKEALALRPEPPQALLEAAADAARPRAEAGQVELTVRSAPDLPPVSADPQRLGLALNNLLDNALAYTPPGGRITLSAEPAPGGRVRLSVADTGEGIPPEHLPHVFERFFRVPGKSRAQGTGLGLAIVREVVAAHGGEVACGSAPGRGTTFHLTLPAWPVTG